MGGFHKQVQKVKPWFVTSISVAPVKLIEFVISHRETSKMTGFCMHVGKIYYSYGNPERYRKQAK